MVTVFLRTIIIYFILTFTMRVMGKRQIGELEISELIVTFMLSELATIPISDSEVPLLNAIVPILLLVSLEGILSYLTLKIPFFKKAIYGKPSILIKEGNLDQNELKNQRIELSELICAVRQNGIPTLEDVNYAILEENGKLSIFPKSYSAPITPKQVNISTNDDGIGLPLIMDRRIIKENMKLRGWNEFRLEKELSSRKIKLKDVFLMSVDDNGKIYIIRKDKSQ